MVEGFQQFTRFSWLVNQGASFTQRHKDLVLYDRTAVSSTDRLILSPFTLGFRAGGSPETIQIVIPPALYPMVLRLFHRRSSDYIIYHVHDGSLACSRWGSYSIHMYVWFPADCLHSILFLWYSLHVNTGAIEMLSIPKKIWKHQVFHILSTFKKLTKFRRIWCLDRDSSI